MGIKTRSQDYRPSDDDSDSSYSDSDDEDSDPLEEFVTMIMCTLGEHQLNQKRKRESPPTVEPRKRRKHVIPPDMRVTDWASLMRLAEACKAKHYVDCDNLGDAFPVLSEINSLVGLETFKESLALQVISYCVEKNRTKETMKHVSIVGPTGTCKTTLARLLGKLYCKLKITKKSNVIVAGRSMLIGGYIGQTAIKTKDVIDRAMKTGSTLFIDEFYSFSGDVYSAECLATLLQALTDFPDKFVCIVAGYEKETRAVFDSNEGLRRRFPWHFVIKPYTHEEMYQIFLKMCVDEELEAPKELTSAFFARHAERLTQNGGSVENLVNHAKNINIFRMHGTGVYGDLNMQDLETSALNMPLNPGSTKDFETFKAIMNDSSHQMSANLKAHWNDMSDTEKAKFLEKNKEKPSPDGMYM